MFFFLYVLYLLFELFNFSLIFPIVHSNLLFESFLLVFDCLFQFRSLHVKVPLFYFGLFLILLFEIPYLLLIFYSISLHLIDNFIHVFVKPFLNFDFLLLKLLKSGFFLLFRLIIKIFNFFSLCFIFLIIFNLNLQFMNVLLLYSYRCFIFCFNITKLFLKVCLLLIHACFYLTNAILRFLCDLIIGSKFFILFSQFF
jgi:hypothetical protein